MRSQAADLAGPDLTIVVDVANVMGARAGGWWRDRAGAAARLCREVAVMASRGLDVATLPAAGLEVVGERCFPHWVLVLEGRSREATDSAYRQDLGELDAFVNIVLAHGSGDDTIARMAADLPGYRLVVTADRELRARCERAGAHLAGPRWLLGLLEDVTLK